MTALRPAERDTRLQLVRCDARRGSSRRRPSITAPRVRPSRLALGTGRRAEAEREPAGLSYIPCAFLHMDSDVDRRDGQRLYPPRWAMKLVH